MMKGRMMIGLVAGGLLGLTAAAMAKPSYRMMIMKKARTQGKRLMRMAKQHFPL